MQSRHRSKFAQSNLGLTSDIEQRHIERLAGCGRDGSRLLMGARGLK